MTESRTKASHCVDATHVDVVAIVSPSRRAVKSVGLLALEKLVDSEQCCVRNA